MRPRMDRHLDRVLAAAEAPGASGAAPTVAIADTTVHGVRVPKRGPQLPCEFNWHDYAAFLLEVAAEIEHSLMVQYLFAAYSVGGPQAPSHLRQQVRAWQETILGVAKEEMGHLVTVQNVRTALGLPLHLDREDYPWGSRFYPFEFTLERLSLDTLATYVCAESPTGWRGKEADEIRRRAAVEAGGAVNRVGALYKEIAQILGDRTRIPDAAFDASTVPQQASWAEWGRGYREGARGASGNVPDVPPPDLLVLEVSSRDSALEALEEIGEQGESPRPLDDDAADADEDSHFIRFRTIYRALRRLSKAERDLVSRPLPPNPTADALEDPARCWAHLFNVRYRMLLVNLAHSFELADAPGAATAVNARGALINRTFGEMYNLRAIAGQLVGLGTGPPFQMPYTLVLPRRERDRWRLHGDLLAASGALIATLTPLASSPGADYLAALAEADALAREQVERMLGAGRAIAAAGARA